MFSGTAKPLVNAEIFILNKLIDMKINKVKGYIGVLLAMSLVLIGCQSSGNNSNDKVKQNTIVLLKFKTQPEKSAKTISELTKFIEKVKLEPNFIEIKLHVDSEDSTNILLYEVWSDETYYNTDHMQTDHIQEFMANSINFLAGPPEITFWKIEKEFK